MDRENAFCEHCWNLITVYHLTVPYGQTIAGRVSAGFKRLCKPEINQLCKTMQPPLPVYLLMNPLSCSVVAYVCRLDPFQYFYGSHPHRFPIHFTAIMDESCWRKHTLATHNSGCPPLTAQLISELLGWILDAKRAIFQQSHSDSMHTAVTFVRWYPHTKVPQQVALQPISPVNPCNLSSAISTNWAARVPLAHIIFVG